MKKNVFIFGGLAGLIISTFMVCSIALCYHKEQYEGSMVIGYAAMLISFSFIFVGIRNYRNKYNGGVISFGKAFTIGLYISLIASTIYVLAWLVDYYMFIPDYMDKYAEHAIKQAQQKGVSAAEMSKTVEQMNGYKEAYKSPILVILFTYLEILPVGLVVSLISALLLKKKNKPHETFLSNA
ncbi:MAG: DUF4199 domain-containing protein [Chitinophagaceae bacterium]